MLFERMAELEAALELAHVMHEFLATCTTCTLFEGLALTGLLRRLFRLNSALAHANERLEMSTASATATCTDEESSDEDNEKDRETSDSCGTKSCGDAHTWRRSARVAATSVRTSAT